MKKPKRNVNTVFIHCSASNNLNHDNIKTIRRWHLERNFTDVGYHFFIQSNGTVETGRSLEEIPAAQAMHNTGSIAICLHGKEPKDFNENQFNSLRDLCNDIQRMYATALRFRGHNEVAKKLCPVFDYRRVLGLDANGYLTTINVQKKEDNMKLGMPRINQPSTWQGLAGLAGSVGIAVEPALLEQILAIVGAVVSIISLFKNETTR
jgi:hypothetical protein